MELLTPFHIIFLAVVALLIFGPRRLPELGSAVGKTIREFQKSMREATETPPAPQGESSGQSGQKDEKPPEDGSRSQPS